MIKRECLRENEKERVSMVLLRPLSLERTAGQSGPVRERERKREREKERE